MSLRLDREVGVARRTMELLAPAGGREQLEMAIHFGADAVYLAGRRWGMRSSPRNFADDELGPAVAFAHERGVSAHVALNTLMSNIVAPCNGSSRSQPKRSGNWKYVVWMTCSKS